MEDPSSLSQKASLTLNKTSVKIVKTARKLPPPAMAFSSPAARPADKVYKIDPDSFQKLVQELTGQRSHSQPSSKLFPSRLQRIAPPPLVSPSLPESKLDSAAMGPSGGFPALPLPSPRMFSSLPELSPGDNVWIPSSSSSSQAYPAMTAMVGSPIAAGSLHWTPPGFFPFFFGFNPGLGFSPGLGFNPGFGLNPGLGFNPGSAGFNPGGHNHRLGNPGSDNKVEECHVSFNPRPPQ